jgi:hypothetical protein
LQAADEGGPIGHQIGQTETVQMRQKRLERAAERRLESAQAAHGATAAGGEAADEAVEILEPPNHVADADLLRRASEAHPAAASAEGHHEAFRLQPLGHLGQMVARYAIAARDLIDRQLPVAGGERHQHAQGIIAVEA